MKKGIFSGIIVVVVAACLVVAPHQARAQEKSKNPEASRVKASKLLPAGYSADDLFLTGSATLAGFSVDEVYLTGSATLAGGSVDVKFKKSLSKFASDIKVSDITVMVTPVGSWSGIYVMNMNLDGFTVMSGAGDLNARFNWIVVGK